MKISRTKKMKRPRCSETESKCFGCCFGRSMAYSTVRLPHLVHENSQATCIKNFFRHRTARSTRCVCTNIIYNKMCYAQFKFISMHSRKCPKIHSKIQRALRFFRCSFSPATANSMDISIDSNKVQLIAILFRHSRTKFITNATRLNCVCAHPIRLQQCDTAFAVERWIFIYIFNFPFISADLTFFLQPSPVRTSKTGAQLPHAWDSSVGRCYTKIPKRRTRTICGNIEKFIQEIEGFPCHFVACY